MLISSGALLCVGSLHEAGVPTVICFQACLFAPNVACLFISSATAELVRLCVCVSVCEVLDVHTCMCIYDVCKFGCGVALYNSSDYKICMLSTAKEIKTEGTNRKN